MIEQAIEQYARARVDGSTFRNDADAVAFARQLEYVYSKTYDVEFPELSMANGDIIPIDTTVSSGAETYVYYTYETIGAARIMNSYASVNSPRVDLAGRKTVGTIFPILNSYGYNLQDIRAQTMAGGNYNLPRDKARASKRATMQVMDTVGWFGDEEHALPGLLNHPNVTHSTAPVGGTSTQRSLKLKTPDEVIADFADLINTPDDLSNGVESVTHVAVASEVWSNLMGRRLTDTGSTIGKFLIEAYPDITFMSVPRLNAAGHPDSEEFAGEALMVAYRKGDGHGTLVVPQDYEQLPPQDDGLETIVHTHARIGGVKLAYPISVHVYRDITGDP